jgi:hypothetical protein
MPTDDWPEKPSDNAQPADGGRYPAASLLTPLCLSMAKDNRLKIDLADFNTCLCGRSYPAGKGCN